MDARAWRDAGEADDDFAPLEQIPGALDGGVLVICDHAANALPRRYGDLGLPREARERHIAYDIGAAWLARRLAERLDAPAVLSTYSRLLIDANRGGDDPTLVMRVSDGDLVPGNARIDAEEIARRRSRYWAPYRGGDCGDGRSDAGERRAAGDPVDPLVHAALAGTSAAVEGRRAVGFRSAPARAADSRRSARSATSAPMRSATTSPTTAGCPATRSTPSPPRAASPTR